MARSRPRRQTTGATSTGANDAPASGGPCLRQTALAAFSLLVLLTLPAAAELRIAVTADPALPVPNLMENAKFEAGDEHAPTDWGASTSLPRGGSFERITEGGRDGAFMRVDGFTSQTNAYLSQVTPVEEDTLYRAGAWVRMRGGTMVMWMHWWVDETRFDERAYLHSWGSAPIVPDFVRLEWTDSPDPNEWIWVGREFSTWKGQHNVNMHLGAYFDRSSMDIDGAFLGLARTTLTVEVTGGEIARVRVQNDADEDVWDSGELAGGTTAVRHELPDLPTDARYQVIATQPDGTEVEAWYPEEQ